MDIDIFVRLLFPLLNLSSGKPQRKRHFPNMTLEEMILKRCRLNDKKVKYGLTMDEEEELKHIEYILNTLSEDRIIHQKFKTRGEIPNYDTISMDNIFPEAVCYNVTIGNPKEGFQRTYFPNKKNK